MPALSRFGSAVKDKGVEVLAIERSYLLNPLAAYVQREKPAFRVGVNSLLPERIGFRFDTRNTAEEKVYDCVNTTWVIAPDRTVVWRSRGISSVEAYEKVEPEIRQALQKLGVELPPAEKIGRAHV